MVGKIHYEGKDYDLKHGSVVIAKNAVEKGLSVAPYIKTSLSPGSGVVTEYFDAAGLTKYLD
jgi:aconitate hydratase